MVFYILHRFQIDRDDLIKFLLFAGIVWASITIIQQFTYPHFLFFSRFDPSRPDPIEYRAGIYRYMIDGFYFGTISAFLALNRFLDQKKTRYLVLAGFLFTGIYYYGTRQILFVSIASASLMVLWYVIKKGSRLEIKFIFFVFTFFVALAASYESIFKKLIDVTKEDANDDNIRLLSYRYFLFEFWPHKINFFLGNGFPKYNSEAGLALRKLISRGLFQADVGIVGTLSVYGIFYTIISTTMLIHNTIKRIDFQSAYIPITFISIILTLPLSAIFLSGSGAVVLSTLMYLQDWACQDYKRSKLSEKLVQSQIRHRW
ncbi:MAG: hypothetical protein IPK50_16110 [Fibrobacterota bacterium]|nr:MAG: hypothetical protein IPK50_16110 [Fibrobacterota bacterium]